MTSSSPSPTLPLEQQPHRLSRFIEGSECTNLDFVTAPPSSTSHLLSILAQMDEFEQRKQQRNQEYRSSACSVESFASTSTSSNTNTADMEMLMLGAKEGRRVVSFGSAVSSSSGCSSTFGNRKRSWSAGLRDEFRRSSDLKSDLDDVKSMTRRWAERLKAFTVGKGRSVQVSEAP